MRLVKVGPSHGQLKVIEHWSKSIPRYAILSHLWSDNAADEVLFADVERSTAKTKPGYRKLSHALAQAAADGYEWLWIDTCCIDKSSSTELTEAINSMYNFYARAEKCYAYLEDVVLVPGVKPMEMLARSRWWWTRGFTLQELLAPSSVMFFSRDWKPLGTKAQLKHDIESLTGIEVEYLDGSTPITHASIAKRMSWAAARDTRREEDVAYCLMGLFSVNMPMLYGEGERKAFHRLQIEIMKDSDDHSIFAWMSNSESAPRHFERQEQESEVVERLGSALDNAQTSSLPIDDPRDFRPPVEELETLHIQPRDAVDQRHGLLADSPRDFAASGQYRAYDRDSGAQWPHSMTNKGLQIELPIVYSEDSRMYIAALNCPVPLLQNSGYLGLYLEKVHGQRWARVLTETLGTVTDEELIDTGNGNGLTQTLHVPQTFTPLRKRTYFPHHFFHISRFSHNGRYFVIDAQSRYDDRSGRRHLPRLVKIGAVSIMDDRIPSSFKIVNEADMLSAALFIREIDDAKTTIILLLGCSKLAEVSFDLWETRRGYKALHWSQLQGLFKGTKPGDVMHADRHRAWVHAHEVIEEGCKIWFLDIGVGPSTSRGDKCLVNHPEDATWD